MPTYAIKEMIDVPAKFTLHLSFICFLLHTELHHVEYFK